MCNGSTQDFGSCSQGSNPCGATKCPGIFPVKAIMKKVIIALCVAIAVLIATVCISDKRQEKEMAVQMDYARICESFIRDYITEVSALRDCVVRDDETDSVIVRIDSIGYQFAKVTDILEYNIFAFDRNMYWEQTYSNIR